MKIRSHSFNSKMQTLIREQELSRIGTDYA